MPAPYPNQYLHVLDKRNGTEWIYPIHPKQKLNFEAILKRWVKQEFSGELKINGEIGRPGLDIFEYYAQIKLDAEPPDSVRCWTSGGFDLITTY
jgi:hypothetical protein